MTLGIKDRIINIILELKGLINSNKPLILIVIIIFIIVLLTYLYSKDTRIKKLRKNIDNNYIYDSPRLTIDYCFDNSNTISNIIIEAEIDVLNNKLTSTDKYDFTQHGISSEYFVRITGTESNNSETGNPYKIKRIEDNNILVFHHLGAKLQPEVLATTSATSNKYSKYTETVTLTFYKPNSNVNKYKHTKLADYYVCSSYRSFLPGNQVLDYCDVSMLNKCLYYGARYLELEIYDKDKNADTIPIVKAGYDDSNISLNFNFLELDKCIKKIAEVAFSKRHIYNYTDPLFLYLDVKTTNYRTQDKIYDIIELYLKRFLLDRSRYNHINMAQTTLCELKQKCVIFSSSSFQNSKLDKIINSSLDRGTIKRMTYHEAMLDNDEMKGAKFNYMSNNISFKTGFNHYIEFGDPEINLFSYGLLNGDIVRIDGASNPVNNSGEHVFKISQVTKNKIVFDKSVKFKNESVGSNIKVLAYEKESKEEPLEEHNKDNLTIVIPDSSFMSTNYNTQNIHYKGVQFAALSFSNPDKFMVSYFETFKKKAIIMKPKYLLDSVFIPKTPSLNSKVPKLESSKLKLNIDYIFFDKLSKNKKDFSIIPFVDGKTRIINDERVARISIDNNKFKSLVTVKKGLNKKNGYISFLNKDANGVERYLCYNNSCCYLYFNKITNGDTNNSYYVEKMSEQASFIPLKSVKSKKGYNSIGVVKKKMINNESTDVLYYVKTRSEYSSSEKLYTVIKKDYIVKGFLVNRGHSNYKGINSSKHIAILKPKFSKNKGFYPVGDIFIDIKRLDEIIVSSQTNIIINNFQEKIQTKLFSGAVDKPIDYELVWDNKDDKKVAQKAISNETIASKSTDAVESSSDNSMELSIWRPIPNEGYMAVGVICVAGYRKPLLSDVVCVSVDYLSESNIVENNIGGTPDAGNKGCLEIPKEEDDSVVPLFADPLWFDKKSNLILWSNNKHSYAKPDTYINIYNDVDILKIIPPLVFDFKMYDFILEEQDYNDRLYLDSIIKSNQQKEDTLFRFIEEKTIIEGGGVVYDYLLKKDNTNGKFVSYTKSLNGGKMCMGLPQAYWTKYYKETIEENESSSNSFDELELPDEAKKIKFEACNERDNFGTNWNFYNDKSVRLEDNNKYCLTYKKDGDGKISTDIEDPNNFVFISDCHPKLENQKFLYEKNNLKVFTGTSYDPNACVTHTADDDSRLEECGDRKYTALWKWQDYINREDTCSRLDAEEKLKNIGTIEDCVNESYYVVYIPTSKDLDCIIEAKKITNGSDAAIKGCDLAKQDIIVTDCDRVCSEIPFTPGGKSSCSNWNPNKVGDTRNQKSGFNQSLWIDASGETVDHRNIPYGGGWDNVDGKWRCMVGSCWHPTAWAYCQKPIKKSAYKTKICSDFCKKYSGGTQKIKHEEFCDFNQALQNYTSLKKIYPNIVIIHEGRIIKSNINVPSAPKNQYVIQETYDAKCGPKNGNKKCINNGCCSRWGWCGNSNQHCSNYFLGKANSSNKCPPGSLEVPSNECIEGAKSAGETVGREFTTTKFWGSYDWVPPGCSVHTENVNSDINAHFNSDSNGLNNGKYQKVCKKTKSIGIQNGIFDGKESPKTKYNYVSKVDIVPGEKIIRGWWGHPDHLYSDVYGIDITQNILNSSDVKLVASTSEWGDPAPGIRKILVIDTKLVTDQTSESITLMIENYKKELSTMLSSCYKCKYPSRAICTEKNIIRSDDTYYENDMEQDEISKFCSRLNKNSDFKCDKFYRQKFVYNSNTDDFCLGLYKPVYINISNNEEFPELNIDLRRIINKKKTGFDSSEELAIKEYYPFDNLLGENYEKNGCYNIFIKGLITPNKKSDFKYDIVFDNDKIRGLKQNRITLPNTDTRIILDYIPNYKNIKKGDKVIVEFRPKDLHSKENNAFKTCSRTGNNNIIIFHKQYIRWMGVVIEPLGNNKLKIMMSINSYEPNNKLITNVGNRLREFNVSNPVIVKDISDVILIKKAPLCL